MTAQSGHVVVVGAGISGLTAALRISESAPPGTSVEVWEASERVGGKLRTSPFAGRAAVDEGADAFLARVPHGTALARHLGLDLVSPEPATAAIWHGGLHSIPEGLVLGVPAGLTKLAASPLLSWRGKARAAIEPLLPRHDHGDSIGRLVRARFGDEVHVRLVDSLVGSIYGADTDRFSLAMVPQLDALARAGRSMLLAGRSMKRTAAPEGGPLFYAPAVGMESLAAGVAGTLTARGVAIRANTVATSLRQAGRRWRVSGSDGDVSADAVVLALPAAAGASLLKADPAARADTGGALLGSGLSTLDAAGVAIVTIAVGNWPERLHGRSGYLVPKDVQRTVTAASFGSQKWARWRSDDDTEVLRISLGRDGASIDHLDDDELVERAVAETGVHVGVDLQPTVVRVTRWPRAFPQYRPDHRCWLAAIDAATPAGVFLTGASYRGIGVPACIADAERTAASVTAFLSR